MAHKETIKELAIKFDQDAIAFLEKYGDDSDQVTQDVLMMTATSMKAALQKADDTSILMAKNSMRIFEAYVAKTFEAHGYKLEAEESKKAAMTDPLTGIGNRAVLKSELSEAIQSYNTEFDDGGNKRYFAFVKIDLDRFKGLNDEYGHATGDAAIKAFAQKLKDCTRTQSWGMSQNGTMTERDQTDQLFSSFGEDQQSGGDNAVSRSGGDEFTLMMNTTAKSLPEAKVKLRRGYQRVREALQGISFEHDGMTFPLTASMGVAYIRPRDDEKTLYDRADQAAMGDKATKDVRYEAAVERLKNSGAENVRTVADIRAIEDAKQQVAMDAARSDEHANN